MPLNQSPWTSQIAALAGLTAPAANALLQGGEVIALPAKATVFHAGMSAANMLFVLHGSVRVQQTSENGNEIVLYRVRAGESCILTTACLLSHETYAATGIAETDVKAVAIPRRVFDDLLATSPVFRDVVFQNFSRRITDLFAMVEDVAFQRIDVRLAQALLRLAEGRAVVTATHQELSVELGTAREVISRQLQELQRRGWIALSRGKVTLLDASQLADLAKLGGR